MKQANDLRQENILLTQTCANQFWLEYNGLCAFLEQLSSRLLKIRPCSTLPEHIEHEQRKQHQLTIEFSDHRSKLERVMQQHSAQLLALIADNQQETEGIRCRVNQLEELWARVEKDLAICQNELTQAMMKSVEFNSKLEHVSTWFDQTAAPETTTDGSNELDRIRTFKEHLDNKFIDIVNLKQEYTDIEQQNNEVNAVEEQLMEIDSKWSQLNEKIQEQLVADFVSRRQDEGEPMIRRTRNSSRLRI